MKHIFEKNRERSLPTFANINLLGKCNVDCYFCLGKDIPELLNKHNQLNIHFLQWKNFEKFLEICKFHNINKLYITGQNTDSLLYKYLDELIDYLHKKSFKVGIRTNGYLALKKLDIINKCDCSVGYSIHSLNPETNYKIMKRRDIPDWNRIISKTKNPRIAIVVNRYNYNEFFDILKFLSKFKNIKYIQARRISTDTRAEFLAEDAIIYENLYKYVSKTFPRLPNFYDAQRFEIFGMEVCFWRTVKTSVNSFNYFTDGTLSKEYFVVEGYIKNYKRS